MISLLLSYFYEFELLEVDYIHVPHQTFNGMCQAAYPMEECYFTYVVQPKPRNGPNMGYVLALVNHRTMSKTWKGYLSP